MSRLVQIGYNPGFPVETRDYWKYSPYTRPPEWLTDYARIREITKWPVLDTGTGDTGDTYVLGPTGEKIVSVPNGGWILRGHIPGTFIGISTKQKNLLYVEKD